MTEKTKNSTTSNISVKAFSKKVNASSDRLLNQFKDTGISVEAFAKEVNTSPDRLLNQFKDAGISIDASQTVTEAQKKALLDYLTTHHGHDASSKKIVIHRKKTSVVIGRTSNTKTGAAQEISIVTRRKVYVPPTLDSAGLDKKAASRPSADQTSREDAPLLSNNAHHVSAQSSILPETTGTTESLITSGSTNIHTAEGNKSPDNLASQEEHAFKKSGSSKTVEPIIASSTADKKEVSTGLFSKKEPENSSKEEKDSFHKEKRGLSKELDIEKGRHKKKKSRTQRLDDHLELLRGGIDIRMVLPSEDDEGGSVRYSDKKSVEKGNGTAGRQKAAIAASASVHKVALHAFKKPRAPIVHDILVPETILVSELAQRLSVKAQVVLKTLMRLGRASTAMDLLDQETAILVVEEMGHHARPTDENALENVLMKAVKEDDRPLVARPPVVTIMGHVDHGKTTLLDYIRSTTVASGEAGGITQHIGAYQVKTDKGVLTFLDTPGHAAFTAMRARGATLTDIVVLVVAADDGVMPQTIEAIEHAKAAKVPIVVALNKMDKPTVDPDRVQNELSKQGLIVEHWGGDTMCVPISAKTGMGVDALLEVILLQADLLELKAPADGLANGIVIEARLDRNRGAIMSVLVQRGTLRKGDFVLAGQNCARIRALFDEKGHAIHAAGPSTPVELLGFSTMPTAGEEFIVVSDEKQARAVAALRKNKQRVATLVQKAATSGELLQHMVDQKKTTTVLNIVLKADVQGSAEALRHALQQLSTETISINVIASGIGGINESDVYLAMASHAILIGFNVRATAAARTLIDAHHVSAHYHGVIYDVIDAVKKVINGSLAAIIQERTLGIAEVRSLFRSSKTAAIAGCIVLDGILKRNQPMRVLRDNVVVFEGVLESLRRFKEDVPEVRAGIECGIAIKHYHDVKIGDQVEVFEKISIKQEI